MAPRPRRRDRTALDARQAPLRRVAIVAYPEAQLLDVAGPLEVFAGTSRWLRERGVRSDDVYRTELLGPRAGALVTSSGLRLTADRAFSAARGDIDTLLVAGGDVRAAMRDERLLAWLRRMATRVRRLGSVCTGSFVLAAAGLLDGRRATTHWAYAERLARAYPKLSVDPDPIFVRDGHVYTSAGVTAGMDLALALVEEDLGREVALQVARQLVLFLRRPGGQSQFSAQLATQTADREPLREVQSWIVDHLTDDLRVTALAGRAAMSPRNFARAFAAEVGVTPARFVERARVEAARRRLEESTHGVDEVAAECGFGSAESMRSAFVRTLHVPPTAYRNRFRSPTLH